MRSLNHRTQIVHKLDASMVVFDLGLKPNKVVCKSGTGSDAMTHAVVRAVSPKGKVHTYEFNKMRVERASEDFQSNGVGHLVEVHWRDVCGKQRGRPRPAKKNDPEKDPSRMEKTEKPWETENSISHTPPPTRYSSTYLNTGLQ